MKITYLGQDITPRQSNGRFTRKWRKTKATAFILFIGIIGTAIYADHIGLNTVEAESILCDGKSATHDGVTCTASFSDTNMEAKIDAWKEDILNRLASCESGGKKEEDGITVLDSNDVGSYGAFQWQRKSVIHYQKLRTGEDINGRDAIILAMTPDKARDLTRWVIFETESGVANDWVNCSRKHDLQREVDLIKKLLSN